MADIRVLLTEGSSLTSREVLTCLGPLGYHLEVLDGDVLCIARFSRWTRRVHRAPAAASDPRGYLETLVRVVDERAIDVVLPTHEQAWLLANAGALTPPSVRFAVAPAAMFERVQSKLAFALLLDELGLPQPAWRSVTSAADLEELPFPYWLKSAFSTAGQGVREIRDAATRSSALGELLGAAPLIAQQPAQGQYGQVQALFDRGRLLAAHTSVQRAIGVGGSAAARLSVDHELPRAHVATLGEALAWHGGLTLDYMHRDGSPQYIECNPRTVEPGNAAAAGVNLPELQIRLTLGDPLPAAAAIGRASVRTHGTVALLLGAATRDGSRAALLGSLRDALRGRGTYADSAEQLTPIRRDPPSLATASYITARLLVAPRHAASIAGQAVASYALDPAAIALAPGAAPGAGSPHP